MGTIFIKLSSVFFIIFISFSIQSCKVYDKNYISELDAVESTKKVKVNTTDGKTYKFKKLLIVEDQLIGVAKPKSKSAKYLPSEKFVDSEGNTMEKVSINRDTIEEINVYNKKKSKKRTIWLVVGLTLGIVVLAAATAATAVVVSGV